MALKQSVCMPMVFGGVPLSEDLFRRIRAMGFEAVEFWNRDDLGDYRKVFSDAKRAGLEIAAMIGHGSLPEGMNNPANHERIAKELTESIRVAGEFGIAGLICFSGNRNGRDSDETGMAHCGRLLREMAPEAERAGVNLNMELLNSRVDHPGYQCDRSDWGFSLCRLVDSPRVKVLYDIYHMQIMEGDVIRRIRDNIGLIGHFHTAGVPGRQDMDDSQELNYSAVARAIDAAGYDLFVGHEYKPKADVWESLEQTGTIFSCPEGR